MSNNNIDNDPSQRQKNKHMKIFLDDLTTLVDFPSKQIAGHCSFVPSVYQWEVIVNVATSANDQKKVTTDIYRHGMTFIMNPELNEWEEGRWEGYRE